MADFRFNLNKLRRAIEHSPAAAGRGANRALGDIKRDWVREARDIAPLDKNNLRKQIQADVFNPGTNGYIEIEANATQDTGGKRFNYAYYIHEQDAGGKSLLTSGTEKKFLDKSAESQKSEWLTWLTDDIKAELRKEGW